MSSVMKQFEATSALFGANAPFVEELYERYLRDPASVAPEWRAQFDAWQASGGGKDVAHTPVIEAFAAAARRGPLAAPTSVAADDEKQMKVLMFIRAHRTTGSHYSNLDPLRRMDHVSVPELELETYGLGEADLDTVFSMGSFGNRRLRKTLREIVAIVRKTYCDTIGMEYMYLSSMEEKRWLRERFEGTLSTPSLNERQKRFLLERLTASETLERYLHTRYVGQKRFSGEGGESLVPMLDILIEEAGAQGAKEVVIGMAHRGRLNVLVNNLGKIPADLFSEFEGKKAAELASGDVKYHQGFSSDIQTPGGTVHLTLAFNPSHLEIVNPVVEGSVRARQHRRGDFKGETVLPLLIHGDAAFAGQGVVMETLALSQTRGYRTGGTVHVIVNNQIGFTTSDTRDSRSSLYCTGIAKMVEAPVFHVNGDDVEAVAMVAKIALDYRTTFKKDVVIDMVCFRRLGHNEQDEPFVTQPLMYKRIAQHPGTRKLYADRLEKEGLIAPGFADELVTSFRAKLDEGKPTNPKILYGLKHSLAVDWAPYMNVEWRRPADTAVPLDKLKDYAKRLTDIPSNFKLHPTVERMLAGRREMGEGKAALDWGMAENLAYASLVDEGTPVRLSGQDSGRGTFAHRHAVLHDQNREKYDQGTYLPLQHIREGQGSFLVIDSLLSEEAVLGFEYGYATANPFELVLWEAQFGDFANGAQVVIDQFIASGEVKWGRVNGLTLMLPHGYEGQGPEHSSARIERFMQLAADNNMQICQPTSASQIFHLLRRQMVRQFRKPLVIFTPKSLLRAKDATSPLAEFTKGEFRTVIGPSRTEVDADKVKRVIACSGKVAYDLIRRRDEKKAWDVAILRVEQLYPFPHKAFAAELKRFPNATEVVWCQDEPQNQGPWFFVQHYVHENMQDGQKLGYAGRSASASPAVGYAHLHQEQQKALLDQAFGKLKGFVFTK
ncbi:MAG: 2-oxoglutarate dehydrogenase E1 component [Burkholderiales bacterium]|nr:2-oxoglutarate dehydrogenase E1 component [Burkholderiales bacterium]